jgi:hypothetical protein
MFAYSIKELDSSFAMTKLSKEKVDPDTEAIKESTGKVQRSRTTKRRRTGLH